MRRTLVQAAWYLPLRGLHAYGRGSPKPLSYPPLPKSTSFVHVHMPDRSQQVLAVERVSTLSLDQRLWSFLKIPKLLSLWGSFVYPSSKIDNLCRQDSRSKLFRSAWWCEIVKKHSMSVGGFSVVVLGSAGLKPDKICVCLYWSIYLFPEPYISLPSQPWVIDVRVNGIRFRRSESLLWHIELMMSLVM